jgi:hypothetical protein
VNPARRLAQIVTALEQVGLTPADWDDLGTRLNQSTLAAGGALTRGPSGRPGSFQRFLLGQLPDGRDEWLEFWRNHHLLPSFADLYGRHVEGTYGGRTLAFLSLSDLIRSKETERETDWQDVAALEEIHDGRLLHQATAGTISVAQALARLRSRRGLESFLHSGYLKDPAVVGQALLQTQVSITQAIVLPCAGAIPPTSTVPMEPVVVSRLRTVAPVSALHLALIEVVRRQYKLAVQNADAADKQAIRAAQADPPLNDP